MNGIFVESGCAPKSWRQVLASETCQDFLIFASSDLLVSREILVPASLDLRHRLRLPHPATGISKPRSSPSLQVNSDVLIRTGECMLKCHHHHRIKIHRLCAWRGNSISNLVSHFPDVKGSITLFYVITSLSQKDLFILLFASVAGSKKHVGHCRQWNAPKPVEATAMPCV